MFSREEPLHVRSIAASDGLRCDRQWRIIARSILSRAASKSREKKKGHPVGSDLFLAGRWLSRPPAAMNAENLPNARPPVHKI